MASKMNPYGNALFISCALMLLTMVMHPSGGNIEHIRHISFVNVISHGLGIASMPLCVFGFWGLTILLGKKSSLSKLGFALAATGLMCAMLAAAVNGLALTFFVNSLGSIGAKNLPEVKMVLRYNMSLNHAFTCIFICGSCLAIGLWSVIIMQSAMFTKWLGYFGIVICITPLIFIFSGSEILNLHGFRLFILGFALWVLAAGSVLNRQGMLNPADE